MMATRETTNGRPRKLDPELNEYRIDALLVNWAAWARGWPASLGYGVGSTAVGGATPNEDLARRMEIVLLDLKAHRPKLWRAVWLRYVARYGDEGAARAMSGRRRRNRTQVTVHEFRALVKVAYGLIGDRWGA